MPRKMDFENKYKAREAQPFDQKNEMYKRVRWESELREYGRSYYGVVTPKQEPGFRHEDIGLRNAAWYLEMEFARGIIENNFGLFSWDDKIQGMSELPKGLKLDPKDPEYNTRLVKKAGKLYGAVMVGICKMDRRWVYTKGYQLIKRFEYDISISDEYQYVINMAVSMDHEYYKYTPTFIGAAATGLGYSKMAFTAGLLAQFLRQLGYKAIPSGNDTALSVPFAIQAGMGELGRHGLLITPKYGPRVRLCKVFTNLPLVCDEPMEFGVNEFCESCNKCAENCPVQAIAHGERTKAPHNKSNAGNTLKWYMNAEKCFKFWAKNTSDCGNCVRVCAFNKPDAILHDVSRWLIEKLPQLDPLFVRADDLFGYGKQMDPDSFWQNE